MNMKNLGLLLISFALGYFIGVMISFVANGYIVFYRMDYMIVAGIFGGCLFAAIAAAFIYI